MAVNIKGLVSSCSLFLFFLYIVHAYLHRNSYMHSENVSLLNLQQILTIYNSSKHSLLNNLYNSVEAVVISTTSSVFFIQCTRLTMMWILCLAVWWDLPATNFCTRNYPTQKGWQRVYFQSSRYPSKLMMGIKLNMLPSTVRHRISTHTHIYLNRSLHFDLL
jgi:hypothetical protein